MKRFFLILALPLAISTLTGKASARDQKNSSAKATPSPSPSSAEGEMQYARDMTKRLHDEIALYGSNRSIRSQIKKVDEEILQVNKEISAHTADKNQIHAQVARIDDALHSIDLELRDLSVHEPTTLSGGKASLVR